MSKQRTKTLLSYETTKPLHDFIEDSFSLKAVGYLDFVWFHKLCIGIDIVDILVPQWYPVAPVQGANVVVNSSLHRVPVVFHWRQKQTLLSRSSWKTTGCLLNGLASDLPRQAGVMSPLRDLLGRSPEPSPVSSNSQPNLRASCMAVDSKAVWCISFLGMQPTFTHVPPRPDRHSQSTAKLSFSSHYRSRQTLRQKSY